eukprot:COSAG06_NODE_3455_length_5319_cov_12.049425_4_plen_195_part_00
MFVSRCVSSPRNRSPSAPALLAQTQQQGEKKKVAFFQPRLERSPNIEDLPLHSFDLFHIRSNDGSQSAVGRPAAHALPSPRQGGLESLRLAVAERAPRLRTCQHLEHGVLRSMLSAKTVAQLVAYLALAALLADTRREAGLFESASTGAFSALVGFVVCGAGPNGAGVAMWSMRCAVASKVGARERSHPAGGSV